MNTRLLLVVLVLAAAPPSYGQASTPKPVAPGDRTVALTAGLGNVYGYLGASGEKYLGGEALSVSLGLGAIPESDETPGTAAFGAAVRRFTRGARDRGFLEFSVVLVSMTYRTIALGQFENVRRHYGPGLGIGYQHTGSEGFTFVVDAGAGWAVGAGDFHVIGALGIGYTWRR